MNSYQPFITLSKCYDKLGKTRAKRKILIITSPIRLVSSRPSLGITSCAWPLAESLSTCTKTPYSNELCSKYSVANVYLPRNIFNLYFTHSIVMYMLSQSLRGQPGSEIKDSIMVSVAHVFPRVLLATTELLSSRRTRDALDKRQRQPGESSEFLHHLLRITTFSME